MLENIFSEIIFKPKFRSGGKNGCFGIQTSKKIVTSLLIGLGFSPGKKAHSVSVPNYIKKAERKIQASFIRDLFDTDGCLRFRRVNNREKHDYPQIEFGFASVSLRDDLFQMLKKLGFRALKWGKTNNFKLAMAGINNLEKFIEEVSPRSIKHLKKYEFWRKNGHFDANAEVA